MFRDILAAIGITWIIMYGSILDRVRKRLILYYFPPEFFNCALCVGFWSGVIVLAFSRNNYILFPLVAAGVCWIVELMRKLLDELVVLLQFINK